MKRKNGKFSDKAVGKINKKSPEISEIWDEKSDKKGDNFSTESEDALHNSKQIDKNLGDY